MRLFFASIAALLAFASPSRAAVYEFDLVSGGPNGIVGGFIEFASPSNGQNLDLAVTINNPDNASYLVGESLVGRTFIPSQSTVFQYQGLIGSDDLCNSNCTGLLPSTFSLENGVTQLSIGFGVYSPSSPVMADFTLTIPDELQPSVVTPVPEPSTWAMMLIGLMAIAFSLKRSAGSVGKIVPVAPT